MARFLGVLLFGLSGIASGAADGSVRVLLLADLTGPFSAILGQGGVVAAELAHEDVGGTVGGMPVELIVRDTGGNPDKALEVFREVHGERPVDMVTGHMTVQVGRAIQPYAEEQGIIAIHAGASSDIFTNEECSPIGLHWFFDMPAAAQGVRSIVKQGGRRWYFLTIDNIYGRQLSGNTVVALKQAGGEVLGESFLTAPIKSVDAPYRAALAKGADVVALAVGSEAIVDVIRLRYETQALLGGTEKDAQIVVLALYLNHLRQLGLYVANGLQFITSFYWNRDETTRAWAERFRTLQGVMPTAPQAAVYSAVLHYLEAVDRARTEQTDVVLGAMRAAPVDDRVFADAGQIREDGQMIHDLLHVAVKPAEAVTRAEDYLEVREVLPGAEVFHPLSASRCPRLK